MIISKNHCMYKMYSDKDELLYVGISDSVMARLDAHWSTKSWISSVSKVLIFYFDSRKLLEQAEQDCIRLEKPAHNIVYNKFIERPYVKKKKRLQLQAFLEAINKYVPSTGKTWAQCAEELGICNTYISKWKHGKNCPGPKMLRKIEKWSSGAIKADDFAFSKFGGESE